MTGVYVVNAESAIDSIISNSILFQVKGSTHARKKATRGEE